MIKEGSVSAFNKDVAAGGGYQYTATDRVSCRMANQRLTDAVHAAVSLQGKSVLDVGCGDGTYTLELLSLAPKSLLGVDAAADAVARATSLIPAGEKRASFRPLSAYELEKLNRKFDVAIVRGLLHHLYEAERAIASVLKVAREIVVVEPNGNNPLLKVIEKVSAYHREHEEKSYTPRQLRQWFQKHGGRVVGDSYVGLVPFFCPDSAARGLKALEPLVERTPLFRSVACGVYVCRVLSANT